MQSISWYYPLLCVLLFAAEELYFRIADKCNIIDRPNERSSHTRITLRGGGIIFWVGVFCRFCSIRCNGVNTAVSLRV